MIEKFATVTITGVLGPGIAVTSQVFTNVSEINFQIKRNCIDIVQEDKAQKHTTFDYNATATVTYTISGVNATITIAP